MTANLGPDVNARGESSTRTQPFAVSFVCESAVNTTWRQTVELWQAADEIPVFEGGFTFDHFYPWTGDPNGPCLEGWVSLTALLSLTRRLRGGLLVSSVVYRHPALLANMIATLDIVSDGRLDIGLGAGWLESESEAYGFDLLAPGARLNRLEEAVQVIISLLTNEITNFNGEYYQLTDARCEPKGVQKPHPPLCIGGGGVKRTLPLAARFAQHWNLGSGSAESFRRKRQVLTECCNAIGRDPSELRCSTQVRWQPDDPSAFTRELIGYHEAGADLLVAQLTEPYSPDDLIRIAAVVEELQVE